MTSNRTVDSDVAARGRTVPLEIVHCAAPCRNVPVTFTLDRGKRLAMTTSRNRHPQMNEFRIDVASPPDREKLVAEIFFGAEQVAELNQDGAALAIELYPRRDGEAWRLDAEQFIAAIQQARASLLGRG